MSPLASVGIGLVAFGGIVLLLFPTRPGGKIAWRGAEVSSVGAGLPLVVLGVVAVALATTGVVGDDNGASTRTEATPPAGGDGRCLASYFRGVTAGRRVAIEESAQDFVVLRNDQTKTGMVGLTLTDFDRPIGALVFSPLSGNTMFKVREVVDANCRPVEDFSNVSIPELDKRSYQNYNEMRLRLGGRSYGLEFKGGTSLQVDFQRIAE